MRDEEARGGGGRGCPGPPFLCVSPSPDLTMLRIQLGADCLHLESLLGGRRTDLVTWENMGL